MTQKREYGAAAWDFDWGEESRESPPPSDEQQGRPPINGVHPPQLRPFFGYYGGKWRDALKHYPEPDHDTIVEPFAGSAGFSLRHAHRKVILWEVIWLSTENGHRPSPKVRGPGA